MRRVLIGALCCLPVQPVLAAQYVPPPILPVPDAWQGRATGLVRVLDKLDAHVELLTLSAGQTGHYKSLAVTLRACMDRPDGMPHDSAAFLDVQDGHGNGQPFTGWTFANEPSIGVFESPVYGVQLVACQGDTVAPAAPPLPAPVPAPPGLLHDLSPPPAPNAGDNGSDGGALDAPDGIDQGQPTIQPPPGQTVPGQTAPSPEQPPPSGTGDAPDAVYPDGSAPKQP